MQRIYVFFSVLLLCFFCFLSTIIGELKFTITFHDIIRPYQYSALWVLFVCPSVAYGLLPRKRKGVENPKFVPIFSTAVVISLSTFNSKSQRSRSPDVRNLPKKSYIIFVSVFTTQVR